MAGEDFIGIGAWSGPWALTSMTKQTASWKYFGGLKLIDSAASPATEVSEDEHDVCFNIPIDSRWGLYELYQAHCEITNFVLHEEWKSGFDERFEAADRFFVDGWLVWDLGHDWGPGVGGLELHPLREVRFSVPTENDTQYRCLFSDTSNRFNIEGFKSRGTWWLPWGSTTTYLCRDYAWRPWSSEYEIVEGSNEAGDNLWVYREKQLRRHKAEYRIHESQGGRDLKSVADIDSGGALIIQSQLSSYRASSAQPITTSLGATTVVEKNGQKFYNYTVSLEIADAVIPPKLASHLEWTLGASNIWPSFVDGVSSGSSVDVDVLISAADVLSETHAPFEFPVIVKGETSLDGTDRDLPAVPPFDKANNTDGPTEDIYLFGEWTIRIPRPSITIMPGDKEETGGISATEIGLHYTHGVYHDFELVVQDIPLPTDAGTITWSVHDLLEPIPFDLLDPYHIHIGDAATMHTSATVVVQLVDKIGTIYIAQASVGWSEGKGPKIHYDPREPWLPDPYTPSDPGLADPSHPIHPLAHGTLNPRIRVRTTTSIELRDEMSG